MSFPRLSGILLHPISLPSRGGIGDLGPAAYEFIDFLAAFGNFTRLHLVFPTWVLSKIWQLKTRPCEWPGLFLEWII